MENNKKTENWGGARKGAGRKAIGGKSYTFKAYPDVMAFLESYEGNKTQFINEAILKYLKG